MTIPDSIINRNLPKAEDLVMFGTYVEEMTRDELTACLVWALRAEKEVVEEEARKSRLHRH